MSSSQSSSASSLSPLTPRPLPCSCAHLSSAISDQLREKYALAIKWAKSKNQINEKNRNSPTKRAKYTAPECVACGAPTSRPLVCLTCGEIACRGQMHMSKHLKATGHDFGVEPRQGLLICRQCDCDSVYSAELDNIHREVNAHEHDHHRRSSIQNNSNYASLIKPSSGLTCPQPRGMRNLGATCFMSVILQSFLHNPLLHCYYLSDFHNRKSCPHSKQHSQPKSSIPVCLSCETDKLFAEFYSPEFTGVFGPTTYLAAVWSMSKDLAGYAQQDAHEFLTSVLNHIHSATHPAYLSRGCDCIVHTTFGGLLRSDVRCGRCGNVTTTPEPTLDLPLDLRTGVKQEKLTHCLERFTSPEKLAPKQYSCTKCGDAIQEATKRLTIKRLPPVLNIQLKRFEHNSVSQKIDIKVDFSTVLDMRPYVHESVQKRGSDSHYLYDLFAVVNHEGQLNTGHYTNYARYKDEWWHFNDDKIRPCSLNEVTSTNPYLLFYIKRSMLLKSQTLLPH